MLAFSLVGIGVGFPLVGIGVALGVIIAYGNLLHNLVPTTTSGDALHLKTLRAKVTIGITAGDSVTGMSNKIE